MAETYLVFGETRFALEFEHQLREKGLHVFRIANPTRVDQEAFFSNTESTVIIWAQGSSRSDETKFSDYEREFCAYLDFARRIPGKVHHIYISSGGALYKPSLETQNELTPPTPTTKYGWNKIQEEAQISQLIGSGHSFVVFRLANVFGSRFRSGRTGLITRLANMVDSSIESPLRPTCSLDSERQYGLYEDYTRNMLKLTKEPVLQNQVVNLAPIHSYTIREIFQIFLAISPQTAFLKTDLSEGCTQLDSLKITSIHEVVNSGTQWETLQNWVDDRIGNQVRYVEF